MYTFEDGEAIWYLGRNETNPIFNNVNEESFGQLGRISIDTDFIAYILTSEKREEIDAVIMAEDTLKVKLSDLDLQQRPLINSLDSNDGRGYFDIDTVNYDHLNSEQRRVAERIYGQGEDFKENMKMLNENGVRKTRVSVLTPDYIKKNVSRYSALARVSLFRLTGEEPSFYATWRHVDIPDGHLRGLRNVAESNTPKVEVDQVANAYDILLNNPKRALEIITPERAVGLSGLLTTYFLNQQK